MTDIHVHDCNNSQLDQLLSGQSIFTALVKFMMSTAGATVIFSWSAEEREVPVQWVNSCN